MGGGGASVSVGGGVELGLGRAVGSWVTWVVGGGGASVSVGSGVELGARGAAGCSLAGGAEQAVNSRTKKM